MKKGKRSMEDALTPQEAAFLKGKGSGSGAPEASAPVENPVPVPEKRAQHEPGGRPPEATRSTAGKAVSTGVVNSRIDSRITTALLRASFERRLAQEVPWTQREIIAEALTEWLSQRGFKI